MSLKDLSGKHNVHLVYTNSNLVEMYVYDKLKEVCKADSESIIRVENKSSFREMLEALNMQAYFAERWLIVLDYHKIRGTIKSNTAVFKAENACFLVMVSNYKEFKEFSELDITCNKMYLSILRYNDILYLFNGTDVAQKYLDHISRSYSRDPEKVFTLYREVLNGYIITSIKDINNICGQSSSSVSRYAMLLLKDPPVTSKGLSITLRNRVKVAEDLIDAYGISYFRNLLVATVKDILDIKVLYLNGIIYKNVQDLPKGYDEKRLSKYNIYLESIEMVIPYSRIVDLYISLKKEGVWKSKLNFLDFIYMYYSLKECK